MKKSKSNADKKYGSETGFKADVIGKTKNGKKFVLKIVDFSDDIKYIRENKKFYADGGILRRLRIWGPMDDLKKAMKTNKKLKDVKLLIFSLPKDQARYVLHAIGYEGQTLLDFVKEEIEYKLKYVTLDEGNSRERTKEELYPFKVEVKVV